MSTVTPTEATTLLSHADVQSGARLGTGVQDELLSNNSVLDEHEAWTPKLIAYELWVLFRGTIPVVLAYTLQNSFQTVSVFVVGRTMSSPHDLSTAAFSYMIATCTGFIVGMGGSTALDALASSTFTGSKNKHDLGILLQRAFILLAVFYIPVAVIWTASEPVLRAFGQPPRLSRDCGKFLTRLVPGGLGLIYFEATKKYLQAQGLMRAGIYVLSVTAPISWILTYLFVRTWGTFAAPFAVSIGYWLSFLGLILYCKFVAGGDHWGGWSRRCFQNLGIFARLALLGTIQVGTEVFAFAIVALAAGRLGETAIATQSVIMTVDNLIATIPFGIGVTGSVRVGNMLGMRNARGAARSAYTAILLSMLVGLVILVILMSTRARFGRILSGDQDVVNLTATVLPFVALFQVADGMASSCGGSLRGMGRQHIGATVNLLGYYLVGLPLGLYLAFHGWSVSGLWLGLCVALYIVGSVQGVFVIFSNWEYQIERAFDRMDKEDVIENGHGALLSDTASSS